VMPRVIKSDGAREPFDEAKLRSGLLRALEKRPVDTEVVETSINRILHELRSSGEREVPSRLVGETVMKELLGGRNGNERAQKGRCRCLCSVCVGV